jgi:hypothetical protein
MGLLSPWFLGGLLAIGLPVWLHLLRQHKTTPLPFSSLMFFERRIQSASKHRRLKFWALLAMRIAMIALLALLFAKPYLKNNLALGQGQKLGVIVVDQSFSMRYGDRLAKAKQEAGSLAAGWQGRAGQVLALSSRVTPLTQVITDHTSLKGAVESVQQADGMSSWSELARFLRGIQEARRVPLDVHLFTDAQQTSMPPAFADMALQPGTDLTIHSVSNGPSPNWAVESVSAPRQLFDPKRVRVQATVVGYNTPATTRTVSLVMNDRVLATKTVNIPAGGRASVEFVSLDAGYGFNRGEVRIEGGDSLGADDKFRFSVERADPRKVLVAYDSRQARAGLYVRAALEASAEGAFVADVRPIDQAGQLDLDTFAYVILADPATLSSGFEENLKRFVNKGGGLLVALGPGTASRSKVPVAELMMQGSKYASREGDRFQLVGEVDAAHPAMRSSNRLDNVRFFQYVSVDPGDARVVARLSDHSPLLIDKRVGEGRVLVLSSGLDNLANDFPIRSSFVPFIEQASNYLAGLEAQQANVAVDSFIELRHGAGEGTAAEVIGPDGKRVLSLSESAKAQTFAATQEGYYDVRRSGGRKELVAVNADRRESDLTPMTAETVELWRNTGKSTSGEGGTAQGQTEERKPLWPWVLGALIALALAESWFANRYLGTEREPDVEVRKEAA